ncbi:cytochrome P450 [Laetiporus sulphureus 93-53]|uniref:Cytochrome P450 n=1 Tax=Laetiporus sulphureus 93-53 TaxID=1314785 RepID=A0A165CPG7_9APHY|nr:cytochrome P450 [Laetiporus sulphureus 93-53]KZT03181.1 cytochrome P450 [Laetiporus sulphureus 93-53]
MAFDLTSYIGATICCLTILLLAFSRISKHRPKRYLPPGPRGLPLVGNALQIPFEYQQDKFAEWTNIYGDVIYVRVLQKHIVILNSARAARDLLEKRGAMYSDRPRFVLFNELIESFKPNMALLSYGDEWRKHRKWFQMTLSSRVSLDSYRPMQRREVVILLSNMLQTPHDFASHIKRYAAGVLMEISYGHTVTSVDDKFIRMADEAGAEILEIGGAGSALVDFFPVFKYVPTWLPGPGSFKRRALELGQFTRNTMSLPYENVKAEMASGSARPSFVSKRLQEASHPACRAEDEDRIRAGAAVIYQAGIDTTATLLTSFVLAMVLYPEVYRKAQAEMDILVRQARLPNPDDRAMLPYLECVLKEVLRWCCPAPLGVPHYVSQGDQYRDHYIPGGTMIIPNIWAMTRDADVYPDPEVFNPDRFREFTDDTEDALDPRTIVFGFGRRICPGRLLADSNAWLVAANLVATMDIRREYDSSGQEIIPVPVFTSGTVRHPRSFLCKIHPRSNKAVQTIRESNDEVEA